MSLPELIEIVPLTHPVQANLTVPGSKSITNRALVLAALGEGPYQLNGALWSEDTQVMVDCLRKLGFAVHVHPDAAEFANRQLVIQGLGGKIPLGGTEEKPLELFVGNAGTAARFLAAMVCLGHGVYRLHGVPRMHERPQAALFDALRALGYRVDAPGGKVPAVIHGSGPRRGSCQVSLAESSQFASALLLGAGVGGWHVTIAGDNEEESPYVEMTRQLCDVFPPTGGAFTVEPDASGGSYFWGVNALPSPAGGGKHRVSVARWPDSGWQIDAAFPQYLPLPNTLSRSRHLGDSIMTAIVLAPFAAAPTRFTDLGRLRVQECERVKALQTELTKCGANVVEAGDTLEITPSLLHGAEIETYHDHRMAMCFAILGLHVPGIKIKNPACVNKTFPNFFAKLAAPTPAGLGATIRDAATGRVLSGGDLTTI
ncbi:MAG: 3-phosphoshikimate 1-carboxyvinyltransferase [Verrucomicrobiota bacterium]